MNRAQAITFNLYNEVSIIDAKLAYEDYCTAMNSPRSFGVLEQDIIDDIVASYEIADFTIHAIRIAYKAGVPSCLVN